MCFRELWFQVFNLAVIMIRFSGLIVDQVDCLTITLSFVLLCFRKGTALLKMVENILGSDKFNLGIKVSKC